MPGTKDKDQTYVSCYGTVVFDSVESGWVVLQVTLYEIRQDQEGTHPSRGVASC